MITGSFNTDRLIIDKLSFDDAAFIYDLVNTKEWIKFIGDRKIQCLEDANNYIRKALDNRRAKMWVVKLKGELEPIGIITLIQRDHLDYPDIGFAFLPSFAGKGFGFEASTAVLDEIKKAATTATILAITIKENLKSIRLLEKLGLSFQKEMEWAGERILVYST